ncbi:MAG: hypothetical protein JXR31_14730 [Prolixibacteraceae bacterium]|nr:hypothetical protein [Prolixibacteraceae bacterium]MBN2775508.1 hypothetical protein [Prolixibacteraceae bacterium]
MVSNKRTIILLLSLILAGVSYSSANVLVMNGLTHELVALQGEVKKGIIELKNVSESPQSVQLYQRDYWYSYNGENRHDEPGTLERSNAKWININPNFVTIQPNETINVEYEIKVPSVDSLIGSYWSVIMVEGITPPDTTESERGIKINTVIRYAIQIITNIGDTGERNLSFVDFDLSKQENHTELAVAMENIGERLLRPEVSVELFNTDGESQGTVKAEQRKLYPGTSAKVYLDLSRLKAGSYSGILIADCGDDYVFGSNLTLDIKDE